jgi:two-component system, LuxR family, response regulator FixJ
MTTPGTVFIVDDDEAVRVSLKLLLETSGFNAVIYPDGTTFLARVTTAAQGCLLVDIRMPGMGGLEVQRELANRRIMLPVIVVTGHGDVSLAVRAMKAGATDFIEKPFTSQTIIACVERALRLGQESQHEQMAAAAVHERAALLTPREREVLEQLVVGHANKVIAHRLSISPRTVEIHRARVMEKMQARSLSELVRMSIEVGLLARSTE